MPEPSVDITADALAPSGTQPHSSSPAIQTRGLIKMFGDRAALDGVDLLVPRGVAFGFLGPNGAGKTTMIRVLLGLTQASAGSMQLLGHPLPRERALALRRVGAIVEEPSFHPHLSGFENLKIIAAARDAGAYARIEPALARVGLSERAHEKVKRYSLGMRQRLGIARCLLADPLVLILDEPTNGLDPGGIQEFREMIRAMVEHEGRTVFISSHLLDEVEKICDAAAIVDRGKIVTQGPIAELASGGARDELIVGVDDPDRALAMLEGREHVRSAAALGRRPARRLRPAGRPRPRRSTRSSSPPVSPSRASSPCARASSSASSRSPRGWTRPRHRRSTHERDRAAHVRRRPAQAAQEPRHARMGAGARAPAADRAVRRQGDPALLDAERKRARRRHAWVHRRAATPRVCSSARSRPS